MMKLETKKGVKLVNMQKVLSDPNSTYKEKKQALKAEKIKNELRNERGCQVE